MVTDVTLDVQVRRLDERIDNAEGRLDRHEKAQNGSLDKIWDELKSIRAEMKEIKDSLAGRPTWFVTALIGLLGSAVVGLLVQLAKGG